MADPANPEVIWTDGEHRLVFVPKIVNAVEGPRWIYDLIWEQRGRADAIGNAIWERSAAVAGLNNILSLSDWAKVKTLTSAIYAKIHGKLFPPTSPPSGGDPYTPPGDVPKAAYQLAKDFYANEPEGEEKQNKILELYGLLKSAMLGAVIDEREDILQVAKNRKLDAMINVIQERYNYDEADRQINT